jgi:hypothetical protein
MEVSGQFHAPAALPPRKERVPIGWGGGWVGRSGRGGKEKNSQALPGLEPPLPINQPVAQRYTTELSGLLTLYGNLNKLTSNKRKLVNEDDKSSVMNFATVDRSDGDQRVAGSQVFVKSCEVAGTG